MPISIDWGTKVIYVPQNYLTPPATGEVPYTMDLEQFRLDLKDLEDSEDGMPFPDTHVHATEVVMSGVNYSRFIIIANGYTVEFEDGQYVVAPYGANSNLADVKVTNQVSLVLNNSAGLQTVELPGAVSTQDLNDIADAVWDEVLTGATHNVASSAGRRLRQLGDAISGTIVDTGASALEFDTDLTAYATGFFNDQILRFTSGNLQGMVRPVVSFTQSGGHVVLEENLIAVPDNGSEFDMIPMHIHPHHQIAQAVWEELVTDNQVAGSFGEAIAFALGLGGQNVKWSNMTFDVNNLMTGARITLYEDNTLQPTQAVKSWDITATYNVNGELTAYQMVEV